MSKKTELAKMAFDPSMGRKSRKVSLLHVARLVAKRIKQTKAPKSKPTYQKILKFAWVPVAKLGLNYDRQRFPEPKHIEKLLAKWNIICVTPIQARYDAETDTFYIADGQQHAIAWVLMYGEDALVPVFYVEDPDENIESIQLLALNTDSEPMAKYFIHKQNCIMGNADALALEKTVTMADCETAYKKRGPGTITHISDLWNAQEDYGLDNLGAVLSKMRQYWPEEKIYTASMLGLLKVRDTMMHFGVFNDDLFEDVLHACADHFESCERMHLDIKAQFETTYPTNYKGMGNREKVASGIINVYEKRTGKKLCPAPFEINMPMAKSKIAA